MQIEQTLRQKCLEIYGKNLAAILIFGSYFTGNFSKESDVDAIILFKKPIKNTKEELEKSLSDINLFIHHFRTIKDYEQEIYEKGSWSSWVVVQKGSIVCYSTPEFEKFRERLSKRNLPKEKLKKFITKKDEFDLSIDLARKSGWGATKMLYAHIRRKLQIISYYSNNFLEPDYDKCLSNIQQIPHRQKLVKLGELYKNRESLSENEVEEYVKISKELTFLVINILNK